MQFIRRKPHNPFNLSAGLLTCSGNGAFPSSRAGFNDSGIIPEPTMNLQQRELLPIFTAFPFNPPERDQYGAKIY